jgi:DNA repair exonuclease SbcCD ATPase subunit
LEQIGSSGNKLKKLNNLKGKLQHKVTLISEEESFFRENTVCPTCTQTIEDDFRLNKIEEIKNKTKELEKGYSELNQAILDEEERESEFNRISKEIIKINNEISNNNIQLSNFIKQKRELEQEIQKITSKLTNKNAERNNLNQLEIKLDEIKKELYALKEKISYLNFSSYLLKDNGIKSKIIKKYIPLMNQQINKYLQLMDFYINFTLNEEFEEKIKSPIHEDFTYESFSEGEKMRINLALLFTWREIAKVKNSVNTNLLILDEVFDSSLDEMGTDYFSKIIRFIIKDSNIFVISHKTEELIDKFDKIIKFNKVKGFSKIIN